VVLECDVVLDHLYTTASEACLGQPTGYFCNGGLPPVTEPGGRISGAVSLQGSLVEIGQINKIQTAPLPSNNSGGVAWARLNEFVEVSVLMIGDVILTDVTPDDETTALLEWQVFTVETTLHAEPGCNIAPPSAAILQSPYGQSSRLVVNGISMDLRGTLVVQTRGTNTAFIILEGETQMSLGAQTETLVAGQEIDIAYNSGDFNNPSGIARDARPLEFSLIRNLPVMLFDRPVLLPQPGFVATEGLVNMRARPDINSRLLFQVPAGQTMTVLAIDSQQEWYHIRLGNGETGWMKAELLRQNLGLIEEIYDATPQPPQRFGDLGESARVVSEQGGNLRLAPDISFEVLTTLPFGTQVELIARSPYSPWVKVTTGELTGWMALITLETRSAISFLPIDYDVPTPEPNAQPTAIPQSYYSYGGGHAYPDPNGGS